MSIIVHMIGAISRNGSPSLRQRVLFEQLKEHDDILWVVVGANFVVGLLCFLIYRGHAPLFALQLWFVSLCAALLFYWVISRYFRSSDNPYAEKWVPLFTLRASLNGFAWGGFTFLVPDDGVFVGITCAVVTGLVGGAVGSTIFFPAMIAFTLPATFGLGWNLFTLGGDTYPLLALAVVVYLVVSILFSKTIERNYLNFLWLRLKNAALVESLKQQKELAEKASMDKSRFLAAASHDLRQPLHALGLFLNLLKKRNQNLDEKLMENISESMEALKGLFDSLLDISRLDAGVVKADMQAVPLRRLFGALADEFQPLVAEKGLELRIVSSSLSVWSDPVLLESILRNLLSNAVRYTEKGHIVMGCRRRGDKVSIEVADSGIGIPEHLTDQVFEEYFQVGNRERDRSKGLGLGLSIVKREAKLLEHTLNIHSRLGKGTSCSLLTERAPDAQGKDMTLVRAAAEELSLAGYTILVIEDEKDIRSAMAGLLEQYGCRAFVVESGDDACALLEAEGAVPDVIVSDLRLRDGQTGMDAVAMVRSLSQKNIPAILVTGDTAAEPLGSARQQGLRLLHKPVDADLLLDELRRNLLAGGASAPPAG